MLLYTSTSLSFRQKYCPFCLDIIALKNNIMYKFTQYNIYIYIHINIYLLFCSLFHLSLYGVLVSSRTWCFSGAAVGPPKPVWLCEDDLKSFYFNYIQPFMKDISILSISLHSSSWPGMLHDTSTVLKTLVSQPGNSQQDSNVCEVRRPVWEAHSTVEPGLFRGLLCLESLGSL